ncbi:hypothetical protein LTR36_003922 [Oleoguttula mirabilis]|uniref:Uncharacterized protein n=1 Tax=Oleoguttula mirabilis TaxID=1507867 RepID=A0AAV9JHJ1_9PEZI|nr:hypothetical protein LTR36_003922 [Oleoguttula mirabilis]
MTTTPPSGSTGYNPHNINTFRQLLRFSAEQTHILAYSYRTLGFEFHALPLAVRNSAHLPPDLKDVCRDAFLVLADGSLPMPVQLLRMLQSEHERAGHALAAGRLDDVDRLLRGVVEGLKERMVRCVGRLGRALGECGERRGEYRQRVGGGGGGGAWVAERGWEEVGDAAGVG